MNERLQHAIDRLTTLRGRNAVLRVLRPAEGRMLDLHAFDLLYEQRHSFEVISDLLSSAGQIPLLERVGGDAEANRLSRALTRLFHESESLHKERGIRELYVGWPIVQGQFNDGYLLRAPLLLFSVRLKRRTKHWELVAEEAGVVNFNRSFLLGYFSHNGLLLEEGRREGLVPPELPQEPRTFLTSLYRVLDREGIELSFGAEQFEERLRAFSSLDTEELSAQSQSGRLRLQPQGLLGIFSQSQAALIDDYVSLLAKSPPLTEADFVPVSPMASSAVPVSPVGESPVGESPMAVSPVGVSAVGSFVEGFPSCTPLPMDGSQEQAFCRIRAGHSLVVQGPPGTGKSQLIVNLLADFMLRNKRVLLVCQKPAALSVVQERLTALGLGSYVAKVCDVRSDRASLYAELLAQIEALRAATPRPVAGEKSAEWERFSMLNDQLETAERDWLSLRHALYDTQACGLSIQALYLSSEAEGAVLGDTSFSLLIPHAKLQALRERLFSFFHYAQRYAAGHPWAERRSFATYGVSARRALLSALEQTKSFFSSLSEESRLYFRSSLSFEQLKALFSASECLEAFERAYATEQGLSDWELAHRGNARHTAEAFDAVSATLSELLLSPLPCWGLSHEEILCLERDVLRLQKWSKRSVFWWLYTRCWRLPHRVRSACVRYGLAGNAHELEVLSLMLNKRKRLEQLHKTLEQSPWAKDLPAPSAEATHWQTWIKEKNIALGRLLSYAATPLEAMGFVALKPSPKETTAGIEAFMAWLAAQRKRVQELETWLSEKQLQALSVAPASRYDTLKGCLKSDFEDLCAFDRLTAERSAQERELMDALCLVLGGWKREEAWKLLYNTWALTWIERIEDMHPVLREVSRASFEEHIERLIEVQEEKEHLSAKCLAAHLRQRNQEAYDAEASTGNVYAGLMQRMAHKGRQPHVRELLSSFATPLSLLRPCWLVTPQAASALFPLEKSFDLLCFDESSQVFLEEGLPMLYRSKQILVVGDSQQLPPNDHYASRWQQEEKLEGESLLDWASQCFETLFLTGHYRSQSPLLIDFSNKHFYGNRLSFLPAFEALQANKAPIEYIKIDGEWKDKTNPSEAAHVVQLVASLLAARPGVGIGVVTFNQPQQECILQRIDAHRMAHPHMGRDWEQLFVKNIENVQGDERDIIVFSIGYAPGGESQRLIHYFGSLSQIGGEKRLNVAITRAKERIYVVASIQPAELQAERLGSRGGELLRAYLHYAHHVAEHKQVINLSSPHKQDEGPCLRDQIVGWLADDFQTLRFPFADIGSMDSDLLIYTDDSLYWQAPTLKGFYLHLRRLLKEKGWRYACFHSRNYWQQPEQLRLELQACIEKKKSLSQQQMP